MSKDVLKRAREAERTKEQSVRFRIEGGVPLSGDVQLQGAKNAALQALTVSILTSDEVIFDNFPRIGDTDINLSILARFGAKVEELPSGSLSITTRDISRKKNTRQRLFKDNGLKILYTHFGKKNGKCNRRTSWRR